jgi:sodium/hydrogen exchanger-like protein 6/7
MVPKGPKEAHAVIPQIAVMASRYAAVFPLSELINWVFHTRGQRHEEIPHSYQMMLFWAGLRGAVGVALAAGITGDNADALRTTILVVVVMTVVIFGGTTARMLEVLGIRVGVEDDDDSSDDDGGWAAHGGNLALAMGPGSRKYAGRHPYGDDYGEDYNSYVGSPAESPYHTGSFPLDVGRARTPSGVPRSSSYGPKGRQASTGYSAGSSSDSEDNEILPHAQDIEQGVGAGDPPSAGMVFRDGQWFTQLDERYLLPLFSNSVASRRHHLKKAGRKSSTYGGDSSPNQTRGPSLDWGREGHFTGDGADSESGKGKGPSKNFR